MIGDFNSDGKMDLAYLVTTFNQERVSGQQVAVLIGNGAGQFLDAINFFFAGGGPGHLAAGDFSRAVAAPISPFGCPFRRS